MSNTSMVEFQKGYILYSGATLIHYCCKKYGKIIPGIVDQTNLNFCFNLSDYTISKYIK